MSNFPCSSLACSQTMRFFSTFLVNNEAFKVLFPDDTFLDDFVSEVDGLLP